jgi:RimJ/RimL family protein N-acetyltransferase
MLLFIIAKHKQFSGQKVAICLFVDYKPITKTVEIYYFLVSSYIGKQLNTELWVAHLNIVRKEK